jgi:heme A synthase
VDFYSGEFPGTPKITYFDLLTSPGPTSAVDTIGGILTAFGGPLLIVVLALVGLAGRDTAARPLVIVAVTVWAMVVVGVTLGIWASRDDFPLGTGFWVQAACAGIAIVGMLVLLLVSDRATYPAVDAASDGMGT